MIHFWRKATRIMYRIEYRVALVRGWFEIRLFSKGKYNG